MNIELFKFQQIQSKFFFSNKCDLVLKIIIFRLHLIESACESDRVHN